MWGLSTKWSPSSSTLSFSYPSPIWALANRPSTTSSQEKRNSSIIHNTINGYCGFITRRRVQWSWVMRTFNMTTYTIWSGLSGERGGCSRWHQRIRISRIWKRRWSQGRTWRECQHTRVAFSEISYRMIFRFWTLSATAWLFLRIRSSDAWPIRRLWCLRSEPTRKRKAHSDQ